ncbi:hypothetical protein TIFTF001_053089, partial [Ficus carica]
MLAAQSCFYKPPCPASKERFSAKKSRCQAGKSVGDSEDQLEEKMCMGCNLGLAENTARNSRWLRRSELEMAQDLHGLASRTRGRSYSRDMWWLYLWKKGKK